MPKKLYNSKYIQRSEINNGLISANNYRSTIAFIEHMTPHERLLIASINLAISDLRYLEKKQKDSIWRKEQGASINRKECEDYIVMFLGKDVLKKIYKRIRSEQK